MWRGDFDLLAMQLCPARHMRINKNDGMQMHMTCKHTCTPKKQRTTAQPEPRIPCSPRAIPALHSPPANGTERLELELTLARWTARAMVSGEAGGGGVVPPFSCVCDLLASVLAEAATAAAPPHAEGGVAAGADVADFAMTWEDATNEVTVRVANLPGGTKAKHVRATIKDESIHVDVGTLPAGKGTVVSGELFQKVNANECTWAFEDEKGGTRTLVVRRQR